MDFFQAQDNAVRKTKLLVFYYVMAVIMIVISVYAAVTIGYMVYYSQLGGDGSYGSYQVPLWSTVRFLITAAAVCLVVGMGTLFRVVALRGGGSAVASSLGGKAIDRDTRDPKLRQLLNVVDEMAIASGVPVPEVYILPGEASINAFAAGWGTDDAVIAVSGGALEKLTRDELQGVVAHEYSHILNGDCRMNIRLMGLIFGIMMLTIFARLMRYMVFAGSGRRHGGGYVGGGRRSSSDGKGSGGALILAIFVVIILVTIIGFIGTFFGRLIQAAISRQREYLADASAVQFTRNPDGISGALKRIAAGDNHAVLQHPNASEAAHMFFADGLRRSFSSAFSTHPPLNDRILKIQPGWDGKFDLKPVRPRTVAKPEPEEKPAPSRGIIGGGTGMEKIQAMAILGAIGTISSGSLENARSIKAAIPDSFDDSLRSSRGALYGLMALVMADNEEDDAKQWKLVESVFEPEEMPHLREAEATVLQMKRSARLAALELATTTLVQKGGFGMDQYYDLIDRLIEVDQNTTLFEVCMRRIIRERLNRGGGQPRGGGANYMTIPPKVAEALGTVLMVVARDASGAEDPKALVEKATNGLYLLKGKVKTVDVETSSLDEALDILQETSFAIRAQLLRAVVACINEDGQLEPSEAEVLRMLALALQCPVPPLGGD